MHNDDDDDDETKAYKKQVRESAHRFAVDSGFRNFVMCIALELVHRDYDVRQVSIALHAITASARELLNAATSEDTATSEDDSDMHDLRARCAAMAEADEIRKHASAQEVKCDEASVVLELVGRTLVGTGGHRLPSGLIRYLEAHGIQVPTEFR